MFDYKKLSHIAQYRAEAYKHAAPFPHAVIDGFLDAKFMNRLSGEFPKPKEQEWYRYDNVFEKKLTCNMVHRLPAEYQAMLAQFNSGAFIDFIQALTGIEGLIPDPHFRGGGLHQTSPGGKLDIHADFNWHGELHLDRRVNVLLYFNKNWQDEWGGHLELWDRMMSGCVQRIAPVFNRMVIFNTTDYSYHGHPEPLKCPEDVTRKSLALYYYTNGRPDAEKSERHSTLYQKRPSDITTAEVEELRMKRANGKLN